MPVLNDLQRNRLIRLHGIERHDEPPWRLRNLLTFCWNWKTKIKESWGLCFGWSSRTKGNGSPAPWLSRTILEMFWNAKCKLNMRFIEMLKHNLICKNESLGFTLGPWILPLMNEWVPSPRCGNWESHIYVWNMPDAFWKSGLLDPKVVDQIATGSETGSIPMCGTCPCGQGTKKRDPEIVMWKFEIWSVTPWKPEALYQLCMYKRA